MPAWFRRLRARIKYRHFERDLKNEIETHRAMAHSSYDPLTDAAERRRRTAILMGNVTLAREDARAVWMPAAVQQFLQDARYAGRALRHNVGFTVAAVSMLALGLGMTVGGLTVLNGMYMRGWNVPDNGDVFRAVPVFPETAGRVADGLSYGAHKHLQTHAKAAGYASQHAAFLRIASERGGQTLHRFSIFVSDGFFETLKIPLQLGTPPIPESRTTEPTVVITDRVWRTLFAHDRQVVGRTAWIGDVPARVAGVTAPGFEGLDRATSVFAPIWAAKVLGGSRSLSEAVTRGSSCCVLVAGRLNPGWSLEQARHELNLLTASYRDSISQPRFAVEVTDTTLGADQRGKRKARRSFSCLARRFSSCSS